MQITEQNLDTLLKVLRKNNIQHCKLGDHEFLFNPTINDPLKHEVIVKEADKGATSYNTKNWEQDVIHMQPSDDMGELNAD